MYLNLVIMSRFTLLALLLLAGFTGVNLHAQLIDYGPWCGAVTSHSAEITVSLTRSRITSLEVSTHRDFPRYRTLPANKRISGASSQLARYSLRYLEPDTQYYYRVRAGNTREFQRVGSFTTLPPEGKPTSFRFAVAADAISRSKSSVYSEIRFQKPRFLLHLGNFHNDLSLIHI